MTERACSKSRFASIKHGIAVTIAIIGLAVVGLLAVVLAAAIVAVAPLIAIGFGVSLIPAYIIWEHRINKINEKSKTNTK